MNQEKTKLGFNGTWSMAVGGMVGGVEIFLVWFKLFVLVALAGWGLTLWDLPMLSRGVTESSPITALFGAASVFMAYEGFQLLTYDYDDISEPKKTLPRALLSAIATVIVVYIIVPLGTTMLIGADQVVRHKEVAFFGRPILLRHFKTKTRRQP